MSQEDYWRERAESAEAKFNTLHDATGGALDRVKQFKANFGVKERSDGTIVVDYEKFAAALGPDGWLELRRIGDEIHHVSGAAGEKPRIRVGAAA